MGRILAWTPSLTGGIVVVRGPCLHGRYSIGSLCVGPSDTMPWSPTIGLLITPQEPIQPRLGGRVEQISSSRWLNPLLSYSHKAVVCPSDASEGTPPGRALGQMT